MRTTEQVIKSHIGKTITKLKRVGTVAMSMANLFQVTPTTGVSCSVSQYRPLFETIAKEVSEKRGFPIY